MIDEVKAHVSRHKTAYLIGAGIGIAGITFLIMRGRHVGVLRVPYGSDEVTVRPLTFFSNRTNVVTIIDKGTKGAPSWVVHCKETGEVFKSQLEAAKTMNLSPSNLSSHLNGRYSDVSGFHFERICMAA